MHFFARGYTSKKADQKSYRTMKVLILAAGYGTRLARDVEKHADQYPHLVGVAKPLLPVAGQPLISHWLDMLKCCPETHDLPVYVVVRPGHLVV